MSETISRLLLCLTILPTYFGCAAQVLSHLTNAPYTATKTVARTRGGQVTTTTGIEARRSDGSVYESQPGFAYINDLGKRINISLYPTRNGYRIFPSDLKPDIRAPLSAEQYLKQEGGAGAKRTAGEWEITTIGIRQIAGVDAVGSLQVNPNGRRIEKWYSPALDINVETKNHSADGDTDTTFSQIHLGEPDTKLFEVPAGYTEDKSGSRPSPPPN